MSCPVVDVRSQRPIIPPTTALLPVVLRLAGNSLVKQVLKKKVLTTQTRRTFHHEVHRSIRGIVRKRPGLPNKTVPKARIAVDGACNRNSAEVVAGRVPLQRSDSRTMEFKLGGGFRLTGEILDGPRPIGGHHFQRPGCGRFFGGQRRPGLRFGLVRLAPLEVSAEAGYIRREYTDSRVQNRRG